MPRSVPKGSKRYVRAWRCGTNTWGLLKLLVFETSNLIFKVTPGWQKAVEQGSTTPMKSGQSHTKVFLHVGQSCRQNQDAPPRYQLLLMEESWPYWNQIDLDSSSERRQYQRSSTTSREGHKHVPFLGADNIGWETAGTERRLRRIGRNVEDFEKVKYSNFLSFLSLEGWRTSMCVKGRLKARIKYWRYINANREIIEHDISFDTTIFGLHLVNNKAL